MDKIIEDISTLTNGNKYGMKTLIDDIKYIIVKCARMPNGVSVDAGTPGSIPNTYENVLERVVKDRGLPLNSTLEDVIKFDLENPQGHGA